MRWAISIVLVTLAAGCSADPAGDASGTAGSSLQEGSGGDGDGSGGSSPSGSGSGSGGDAQGTTSTSAITSTSTTAGAGGDGGSDPSSGGGSQGGGGEGGEAPVEPDIDTIPWQTGDDVGFGVARKDTQNPRGENAFIGYAGYGIDAEAARSWVTALYRAALRDRGVRWVYAVQGPAQAGYDSAEIGNSKIAAALGTQLTDETGFVLVVGHSSGSFVAHELLRQLQSGLDPDGVTADRVVYFNLDGGLGGLNAAAVNRLRRGYFVGAFDGGTSTSSPNRTDMMNGAAIYPDAGGYIELDAGAAGCNGGATWCVHMTPITSEPHDPADGSEIDYVDFDGRPVTQSYIDDKAAEAGLDLL